MGGWPSDLTAIGLEGLKETKGIPIINATWRDENDQHHFPASVVIEKANVRIGVIGIAAAPTDKRWRERIKTISAEQAIVESIQTLPNDLDAVVALGSINDDMALQLAEKKLGIDLLLTTRGTAYEEPSVSSSKTPIVESPERGRYVQTIYLRLATDRTIPFEKGATDQQWRNWLLEKQQGMETDSLEKIGEGRNMLFIESVALNKSYDSSTEVDSEIENYKQSLRDKAKVIAETKQEITDPYYASAGGCARCHSKEFARWTYSDHAAAWQSLLKRDEAKNPECVACHSTGFAKPGGYGEMNRVSTNKFKAVQCEACHGPMGGHPENKSIVSTPITPSQCKGCHDQANSPEYDHEIYMKRASCQM